MSEYWGSSRWRLKLPQELKALVSGDISPVRSQIDAIQSRLSQQISGMEDSPRKAGLEFLLSTLNNAEEDSQLIVELSKEAARTASSVNRAYNSKRHDSSTKLSSEASKILDKVQFNESVDDFVYRMKTARSVIEGGEIPPPVESQSGSQIREEYLQTVEAIARIILPNFLEDIVIKFASAIVAKETSAPLANSLRYEMAADLKEYDNLPIPDEFQDDTDIVQPQKPSYKGKPFEPVETAFQPSPSFPGRLAPQVGTKFGLKIAVVLLVETGTLVVVKGAQIVSATVGAITSLMSSVAAWLYLAVIAVVAVAIAYAVKKTTEKFQSLTGRYLYLFALQGGVVNISYAVIEDKLDRNSVTNTIVNAFNNFQSYSETRISEGFVFVVDDEEGKPENKIFDGQWITGAYAVASSLQLMEMDKTLWRVTFEAMNAQVDELYRFKGE